jgi:hypothetical protein
VASAHDLINEVLHLVATDHFQMEGDIREISIEGFVRHQCKIRVHLRDRMQSVRLNVHGECTCTDSHS